VFNYDVLRFDHRPSGLAGFSSPRLAVVPGFIADRGLGVGDRRPARKGLSRAVDWPILRV